MEPIEALEISSIVSIGQESQMAIQIKRRIKKEAVNEHQTDKIQRSLSRAKENVEHSDFVSFRRDFAKRVLPLISNQMGSAHSFFATIIKMKKHLYTSAMKT